MKLRWAGVLTLATALTLAAPTAADEPPTPPPPTRTFAFTYEVRVPKPADGAARLDAWVPLPIEDEVQKVADLKVETTAGGAAIPNEVRTEEVYGNRMVHVAVEAPKSEVVVRWTGVVTRSEDVGQGTGPVLDRFKEADRLVPITGLAREIAKRLGADREDQPVAARAKKVYDDVLGTMVYDKTLPGWGFGDFQRACEVGKGNCTDFHAKFTGVARAAGIPVRFTMGIPLSKEAKGVAAGYHCWAHFWDGAHWVPVDVSEAQKVQEKDPARARWFFGHVDADRVSLTIGRDLLLVPHQKGEPLPFFAYPYVEVDGKKADIAKENRTFSFEDRRPSLPR